ncbi:unnamed protein product [Phytomonas sp. Hart1]|nr:unnamed protein product [Phytomonas sp. Hart1]|eukprot:CCW69904.1 unnamed protein product [Phytomonas sp. isolate Hart1]
MSNSISSSVEEEDDDIAYDRDYPLGTRKRYLFKEAMRRLRDERHEQLQGDNPKRECTFHPKVPSGNALKMKTLADAKGSEGDDGLDRHADSGTSAFTRRANQGSKIRVMSLQAEGVTNLEEKSTPASSFFPPMNTPNVLKISPRIHYEKQVLAKEGLPFYGRTVERQREFQRRQHDEEDGKRMPNSYRNGSFSSFTDNESHKTARQAFEERNQKLLQRRIDLQNASIERYATMFHPQILPNSVAIDEAVQARLRARKGRNCLEKDGSRSVKRGELLYQKAMESHMNKIKLVEKLHQQEDDEVCQGYKPNINPYTKEWIQHSEHHELFTKDFVTRQEIYREAREELKDMIAQNEERKNMKERRASSRVHVNSDMILNQVVRLYHNEVKALNEKSPIDCDPAQECSFVPMLSKGSVNIMQKMQNREKDFVSRLARPGASTGRSTECLSRQRTNNELKSDDDKDRHADHSENGFKGRAYENSLRRSPQSISSGTEMVDCRSQTSSLTKRGVTSVKMTAFLQRQLDNQHQREEWIRMVEEKKAAAEKGFCTFQPKTHPSKLRTRRQNPNKQEISEGVSSSLTFVKKEVKRCDVVGKISGVQLFVMRQEEARRRRAEKAALLANIGVCRPPGRDRNNGKGPFKPTEVVPFNLSTERRANWRRSPSQKSNSLQTGEDFSRCTSSKPVLVSWESSPMQRS